MRVECIRAWAVPAKVAYAEAFANPEHRPAQLQSPNRAAKVALAISLRQDVSCH